MKKILFFAIATLVYFAGSAQSISFHDTKGELNVDNSGAAVYSVPIAIPPGINNVGPQIFLNYSSSAGNGTVGYGWTISGISAINRVSSRYDLDGEVDPLDFDDKDRFSLDGQRLIADASNPQLLKTEIFSNLKINIEGSSISNPELFSVNYPDGSKGIYGVSTDAKGYTEWLLTQWTDINGNIIYYTYTTDNNVKYISKISYSRRIGSSTNYENTIEFNYKTRTHPSSGYINGNQIISNKILSHIIVKTNGAQFKKYVISHITNDLNYQMVSQIQEFNGSNEAANPIIFTYDNSTNTINRINNGLATSIDDILDFNILTMGDYDGDGYMDVLSDNKLFRNLYSPSSTSETTMTFESGTLYKNNIKTIENGKLIQANAMVREKPIGQTTGSMSQYPTLESNFKLEISSNKLNTGTNQFQKIIGKQIPYPYLNKMRDTDGCMNIPNYDSFNGKPNTKYLEGDFNGDGLTELVIIGQMIYNDTRLENFDEVSNTNSQNQQTPQDSINANYSENSENQNYLNWLQGIGNGNGELFNLQENYIGDSTAIMQMQETEFVAQSPVIGCNIITNKVPIRTYFVDLNPNLATDESYKFTNITLNFDEKSFVIDFNGDGKQDIFTITNYGYYKIYEWNSITKNFEIITSASISEYSSTNNLLLFGDYNGDGKTDILIPRAKNDSIWSVYISKGNDFDKKIAGITSYDPFRSGSDWEYVHQYYAMDINGDGKSDFVKVLLKQYTPSWSMGRDSFYEITVYDNKTNDAGNPSFQEGSSYRADSDRPFAGMPMVGDFKNASANFQMIILTDNSNADTVVNLIDFKKDQQKDTRLIKVQEASGTLEQRLEYKELRAENTSLYKSTNSESFPNVELNAMPFSYVVSKHIFKAQGKEKYRVFNYRGLTVNLQGQGIFGFKKFASTGWIVDNLNTPIWQVQQIDPSKRGAPIASWSYTGTTTNTSLIDSPVNSSLLGKKTTTFIYSLLPDKRFSLVPQTNIEEDFITGVKTTNTFTYNANWNLIKLIDKKEANGKVFTTETNYTLTDNSAPTDHNFYIGRITKKTIKNMAYGDIYNSEESYTYENNRVAWQYNKGNGTGISSKYHAYDVFGNVNSVKHYGKNNSTAERPIPRELKTEYDPTGRFVIKKTDIAGYETNLTYNDVGQVLELTDKFGKKLITTYDNWGKIISTMKTGDGTSAVSTSYTYARDLNGWNITTQSSQTLAYQKQYFDVLGKNIQNSVKGFSSGYIHTFIEYDFLGRKIRESQPTTSSPSLWLSYQHDYLSRVTQVTHPTGLVATNSYNGLSTTTTEGVKTKIIAKDAWGNTEKVIDNGQTITHNYFAHGGLKTTTYSGQTINLQYDEWGRKTSMLDPSVSPNPFTYQYTNFDEIYKEITSEGTTTYTYDNFGREVNKTSTGTNTNISITNFYDDNALKGLITQVSGSVNNRSFNISYAYDSMYRITSKTETNTNFTSTKSFFYDAYGRTSREDTQTTSTSPAMSSNLSVSYNFHSYSGEMYLVKDVATGKELWKTNTKNQNGQVLTATLGNGTSVTNAYDAYGNITSINQVKGSTSLLGLTYTYNTQRGLLTSRNNAFYNWQENFTYDSFDRLLTWSSPSGTQSNTYYADGRINNNSAVGSYQYVSGAKYKKESIALNTNGQTYYQQRQVQQVTYDMFKRPLSVIEQGQAKVMFAYGLGGRHLSEVRNNSNNLIRSTYYTADGSVEIINNASGEDYIITYIGSPYDASIIKMTKFNGSTKTYDDYHYLHRDFQGSIMAISDAVGAVKERRHFDPWGNIVKVTNASGVTTSTNAKLLLLQRGYTGHEHFTEVGIIHMNGRIYDPILKTFLSPDNFIQDPNNSQSYNRYGYAWNNPLKNSDPSGEVIEIGIGAAILIGALIGGVTYTLSALLTTGVFHPLSFVKSIFLGAVSGAVTFGIGSMADCMFHAGKELIKAGFQAVAHGLYNGAMSALEGGKFLVGAITGAVGSAAGSLTASAQMNTATGLLFGSMVSGMTAELTGSNFWQGAAIGFTVGLLNHASHEIRSLISKANSLVVGIYGAGGDTVGNAAFEKFIRTKGGELFTSSQPDGSTLFGNDGDRKIIDHIQNNSKGKNVEIYGYSRGGAAVIRIVNKLSNFSFAKIVLFDPHSLNAGLFPHTITNTKSKTIFTFWQKKMISWDNPFTGTPVYSPNTYISNFDLTNMPVNHNTIVNYVKNNYSCLLQ